MADFITRLSGRALGVAPVVQPLIASMFAPEPAAHFPALEWDSEATTSSDEPDRLQVPPAQEMPPVRDAPVVPEDTVMARHEEQGTGAHNIPYPTSGTSNVSPNLHHLAGSTESGRRITSGQEDQSIVAHIDLKYPQEKPGAAGSDLSEDRISSGREDRSELSPATPESPRRVPEPALISSHLDESGTLQRRGVSGRDRQDPFKTSTRLPQIPSEPRAETLRRADPDPTRRGVVSTSQRALPESLPFDSSSAQDESGQTVLRPIGTLLVGHDQGATVTSVPPPGIEASPDDNRGMLEPKAALDRSAPPDAPLTVAPRTIRPQPNGKLERGPREPDVPAQEPPAPTIRVNIGRIEVRAIMPPPTPPARREMPARSSPTLSLDDYLKQRNGGQQ
jgi:hypothetical protein